jgi:hypothetical protein
MRSFHNRSLVHSKRKEGGDGQDIALQNESAVRIGSVETGRRREVCIPETADSALFLQGYIDWYFWLHYQSGPFLGNHKLETMSRMSLYTRVCNIVREAENTCLRR